MIIVGILAGPSVASCFNSEQGMGVCLRGEMTEAGILPEPMTASVEPAAITPVATATAPEIAAAPAETTPDAQAAVSPPDAAANDSLIAATFGLLRAEPDGSVVIAGSGTPGSEVEVYSNGSLLGRATVESSGDWVLVPDQPIVPGGTELTLAEVGKEGRAAGSFVVVIDDDKTSEPLVVASTPGAASDVLQGLGRPQAGSSIAVAAADPVPASAEPAVTAPAVVPVTPDNEAVAVAPAAVEPSAPTASEVAEDAIPAAPPQVETPVAVAPAADLPVVAPRDAVVDSGDEAAVAEVPAAPVADDAPIAAPMAPPADIALAAADPASVDIAATVAALAAVPPTIDAIEIEGDRTFFAGGGPEGAAMRLYVDDQFIADTTVSDGRWLVEAGKVLISPSQRIRIDLLQPGSADVASRAEVDFQIDLPEAVPPVVVAAAEEPVATPPVVAPPVVAPTPEPVVPSAPPVSAVVPSEPAPVDAPATAAAPDVLETPATAEPSVADPVPVADAPTVAAPVASDVPTMVAVSVGDAQDQRFASGKAIIRRGDNLWTIARRVYGAGIRYTTIYEANTAQIRDPDRIYPGQVFELPTSQQ